jgi:hypothetical protein
MINGVGSPFENLVAPMPTEEFFDSVWGKTFTHIKGSNDKFTHLLPWNQLNRILRQHRLDFPRLRLVLDGKTLPASSFLNYATGGKRKIPIPRLQPVKLTSQLRQGATLVLDAVDELYRPLEQLAEDLEFLFHEHVQINTYAGWHTSHGFDLHWDDHDVFILQVTGRKRWAVYGMTRNYPFAGDTENAPKPRKDEALWEAVVESGDLLYIPRGWWHVATPLNEPTLHLTVGIHNRKGLDLLRWLTDRLAASEVYRKDLPRLSSPTEQRQHAAKLRDELIRTWSSDLLERYFEDVDAKADSRAKVSLPWSPTAQVLPPENDDTLLKLVSPRPIKFKVENGIVEFSAMKKRWRFAENALPFLQLLEDRRTCAVSDFYTTSAGRLDRKTIDAFLNELLLHGLIAVDES